MTEHLVPTHRPNVLVVDDLRSNRELLEGRLADLGYDVREAKDGVLFALARAVEARDRHTIHHAERVGRYAEAIGGAEGLGPEDCDLLYQGGVLHDLGKIAIPDAILLKPGPLSAEEFSVMKTHSIEGERICLSLRSVAHYLPMIRHHHERIDGAGYPDQIGRASCRERVEGSGGWG